MKEVKYSLAVLFILLHKAVFPQAEFLIDIDWTTGAYVNAGPAIPGVTWVYPGMRAYDEVNGRYIFHGGTSNPNQLYTLNASNASVVYSPVVASGDQLEYDNSTGNLYALNTNIQVVLNTVNQVTGVPVSPPNSLPNFGICQGGTTFNELTHQFICISNTSIIVIDAATGALVSNVTMSIATGEYLVCASIACDNATGILYGLLWDQPVTGKYFFVSVNPATGVVTRIGAGTIQCEQSGCGAIDKVTKRYFYLYSSFPMGGYFIQTVDMATGNVTYNKMVNPMGNNKINYTNLEYDNVRGKLYAIYWDWGGIVPFTMVANYTNASCGACNGTASVNVSGNPPYIYLWSGGQTTNTLTGLCAGTYGVTVTDANQNSGSASVNVQQSNIGNVTIIANEQIICANEHVQICVNGTYSSYQWNNSANTQCVYANAAGNYYVTVTDNNGCTAESNHLSLSVYPSPSVSLSVNGDTLTAYNSVAYQWCLNGNAISGETDSVYIAIQSGSYTVMVTDSNGCTASSSPVIISGIDELSVENAVSVAQMAVDRWQLTVGNSWIGSVAEMFDVNGRVAFKSEIRNTQSEIAPAVSRGVYLLRISSSKSSVVRKLIRL